MNTSNIHRYGSHVVYELWYNITYLKLPSSFFAPKFVVEIHSILNEMNNLH